MQTFSGCKSVYKRVARGLDLDYKIKYKGGIFIREFQSFDGRSIIYQQQRKQDRWLNIYWIDRYADKKSVFLVTLTLGEDVYVDGYGPEKPKEVKYKKKQKEENTNECG